MKKTRLVKRVGMSKQLALHLYDKEIFYSFKTFPPSTVETAPLPPSQTGNDVGSPLVSKAIRSELVAA